MRQWWAEVVALQHGACTLHVRWRRAYYISIADSATNASTNASTIATIASIAAIAIAIQV
jgi:hypothetical protein